MMGRIEEGRDELKGGDDVGLNPFLNRWSLGYDILIPQYARNSFRLNLSRRSQSTPTQSHQSPLDNQQKEEEKTDPYLTTLRKRSAPTPNASHLPPNDPGGFGLAPPAPMRGEGGIE